MVIYIESAAQFHEILNSHVYVMVDFSAEWCGPCKAIAPIYNSLSDANSIDKFFAFLKVDVDRVSEVAQEYGITAMPTFMFFKHGKTVSVNGDVEIKGANPARVKAAVEKMSELARAKAAECA